MATNDTVSLPDVPATWQEILAFVMETEPDAVIAGGAIRDLYLGISSTKDLDIIIPVSGWSEPGNKQSAAAVREPLIAAAIQMAGTSVGLSFDATRALSYGVLFPDVLEVVELPSFMGLDIPCQFVFVDNVGTRATAGRNFSSMSSREVAEALVSRADFGICQIGWTFPTKKKKEWPTGGFVITEAFQEDAAARCFTLRNVTAPLWMHRDRLERFAMRAGFRGWDARISDAARKVLRARREVEEPVYTDKRLDSEEAIWRAIMAQRWKESLDCAE